MLKSSLGIDTAADLIAAIDSKAVEGLPRVGERTALLWRQRLSDAQPNRLPIYLAIALAERLVRHLSAHLPGVRFQVGGGVRELDEWVDSIELEVDEPNGLHEFLKQSALVRKVVLASSRGFANPLRPESYSDSVHLPRPTRPMEDPTHIIVDTLAGPIDIRWGASVRPMAEWLSHPSITEDQIRGDLHVHTDRSPDGRQSLESVAELGQEMGWKYIAITDHGEGLRFGGLDSEGLGRQRQHIEAVREAFHDITILHGSELNIDRTGDLDFPDDILWKLDFRLAGVHSFFDLPRSEQTARLVRAISHPVLHAVAHLTGRRIGIRPPLDLDLEEVFAAAAAHSTALEVNGHLDRLDLSADNVAMAAQMGVLFTVSSDGHRPSEMGNLFNGVRNLQRAGVRPEQVVNTWEPARFLEWLADKSPTKSSS
jgi:histidinol phosphatase-like PHP family hydrolase